MTGQLKGMIGGGVLMATALMGSMGQAQDSTRVQSVNTYGVPGLVEMPNAFMQPDGELTTNIAVFSGGTGRLTFGFQVTPRIQGIFRYSTIPDYLGPGTGRNYDRSFDLRYQLLTEGEIRPAVTIGLQDFGGTGIYAGEYVVASKNINDRLAVTGGIGWGRFGSRGGFSNPLGNLDARFNTRPAGIVGLGGQFSTNQWFRGPAAVFGGVSYRHSDRLTLNAEYSSDAYVRERALGINTDKSPINLGLSYDFSPGVQLSGYTVLGSEIGFNLTFATNPKRPNVGAQGLAPAPVPVRARVPQAQAPDLWSTTWVDDPTSAPVLEENMRVALTEAGLQLESYRLGAREVEVRFRNPTYRAAAQAIGRAARGLSYALPASVEHFVLVPLDPTTGLSGHAVRLSRSDLEDLEGQPDAAWAAYARADISDAAQQTDLTLAQGAAPVWDWELGPYFGTALFSPTNPLRLDIGVELSGRYEPTPGLVFDGALRHKVIGNRNKDNLTAPSALPQVRTLSPFYLIAQDKGVFIPYLKGEYFFRPGENLYGRVSAGIFETMYAGVSSEILWRPDNSRLSFGLEVNALRQRDFEQRLGFRALTATTAHASAYVHHGSGFYSQLDVGQYLAGDRGATYTLRRTFKNGWEVGGYFTKTNVSAAQFGEGSFDKGIQLKIPFDWAMGRTTTRRVEQTIQPVQRDGGARLEGVSSLYEKTRRQAQPALDDGWAQVWR